MRLTAPDSGCARKDVSYADFALLEGGCGVARCCVDKGGEVFVPGAAQTMSSPVAPGFSTASARPAKPRAGVLRRLTSRPLAVIGLAIIALTVAGALFAPWLTAYHPNEQFFDGLTLEGAPLPPDADFWLGHRPARPRPRSPASSTARAPR